MISAFFGLKTGLKKYFRWKIVPLGPLFVQKKNMSMVSLRSCTSVQWPIGHLKCNHCIAFEEVKALYGHKKGCQNKKRKNFGLLRIYFCEKLLIKKFTLFMLRNKISEQTLKWNKWKSWNKTEHMCAFLILQFWCFLGQNLLKCLSKYNQCIHKASVLSALH